MRKRRMTLWGWLGRLWRLFWTADRRQRIRMARLKRRWDEARFKYDPDEPWYAEEEYDDSDFDDDWDGDGDYEDGVSDREIARRQRWLEAMRMECTPVGGRDDGLYRSPYLMEDLPLDDWEEQVWAEDWNEMVSECIDWEEFREWYPGFATFEADDNGDDW